MLNKILHIAPNEKFISNAYYLFEKAFPNNNDFIVINHNSKLKYISSELNVQQKEWNEHTLKEVLSLVNKYDLVIFHGMYYFQSIIITESKSETPFMWIIFGFEIYSNPLLKFDLYGDITKRYLNQNTFKRYLKNKFRNLYYIAKKGYSSPEKLALKAFKKVKFVGALIPEEFEMLRKKRVINPNAKHVVFTYYPLEKISNKIEEKPGENILLGNSCSKTNNHFDAIELLVGLDLKDRKVVVPLNYGDMQYGNKVENYGKEKLGDSFFALRNFLPVDEYYKYISGCGIAVMNHFRQEAVGNVVFMILNGSKVFLDERNITYTYLINLGVEVFSINTDFKRFGKDVLTPLNEETIFRNRKILSQELTENRIVNKLKELTEKLWI